MALAFGFDDDVFEESKVRLDKPTEPYDAKQCEHMWFLEEGADSGDDKLQCLIFQGDALFHQKQWEQAVQAYQSALKITPKRNSAIQRILWESIARCYVHIGNSKLAQEFALKMVDDSQSEDQKMTSQSLLAAVQQGSANYQEEILCLHQCIHYQPFNVQFWLRLAKAYLALSRQSDGGDTSLKENQEGTQCVNTRSTSYRSIPCKCNESKGVQKFYCADHQVCDHEDGCHKSTSQSYLGANINGGTHNCKAVDVESSDSASDVCVDDRNCTGVCHTSTADLAYSDNTSDVIGQCKCNVATILTERTVTEREGSECRRELHDASSALKGLVKDKTGYHHDSNVVEENSSPILCLHSMKNCLNQVPLKFRSQGILECIYFAVGCLVRSSVLLGTVQQTVTSFVKIKNKRLQKEVESLLNGLHIDTSTLQKVRTLTEDDVFGRGNKSEDAMRQDNDDDNEQSNSSRTLLVGKEFEQKWFSWAFKL